MTGEQEREIKLQLKSCSITTHFVISNFLSVANIKIKSTSDKANYIFLIGI